MSFIKSQEFTISYSNTDFMGKWKPESIFQSMQEIAAENAKELGAGFEKLKKQNMAWVLVRLSLEMYSYPSCQEKIIMKTWPGPERRMLFPRYFSIENNNGETIGRASSLWAIIDITTRNIISPAEKKIVLEIPAETPETIPLPGKIHLPEGETSTSEMHPKYSDLDINGHVSNTKYIEWLIDLIPFEMHQEGILSKISVTYSKEIRATDTVKLDFSCHDNNLRLAGRNGEFSSFIINASWEKSL